MSIKPTCLTCMAFDPVKTVKTLSLGYCTNQPGKRVTSKDCCRGHEAHGHPELDLLPTTDGIEVVFHESYHSLIHNDIVYAEE